MRGRTVAINSAYGASSSAPWEASHQPLRRPARVLRGRVLPTAAPLMYYLVQYWGRGDVARLRDARSRTR
ncbi:hypothetical protein [Streptomyces sp. 2231.1]|uniref:hypothetical protein n=1 Tax=Streptomyces sp. 2231.1 TaxID=1855347 RepID=UPI00115FB759|nr:hypothetical protein [Streptomyces sp. 2231.1]